jgi:hypothetical protein
MPSEQRRVGKKEGRRREGEGEQEHITTKERLERKGEKKRGGTLCSVITTAKSSLTI